MPPRRWVIFAGLLAATALASGLRLYGLGDEAYWIDELHSMANSAGRRVEFEALPHNVILEAAPRFPDLTSDSSLSAAWRTMEHDTHPPIYFGLLLAWRWLLGDGEFAVRLLPVLFSVLSIIPVALILVEYGQPRPSLWVALLLAVAFSHIHIAQENRPYSLGLLLVSISYWALVKMEVGWDRFGQRRKILWMIVYGLAIYLALLTHYFTGLALLGQVAVVLLRTQGRLRRAWLVIVALAAVAFALTWGRQLIGQLDYIAGQAWLLERTADHPLRTALRFSDLPIHLLFPCERFKLNYLISFLGALLLAGALLILWRHRCGQAIVFVAWYLVPVATFVVIDLATGKQLLSYVRYASVTVPALTGIIVLAAQRLPRLARWVCVVVLALAVLLTAELPTQSNPRSRWAAELVASRLQPGDLLVYDAIDWPPLWASRIYHTVSYYLPAHLSLPSPPFVLLRDRADPALQQQMAAYERIIVVSPRFDGIPNPFRDRFEHVAATGYVRGIGKIHLFTRSLDEE